MPNKKLYLVPRLAPVMKSDKTTALEVKELLWQLKQDKADLNGAKVKVKNIKDITFNEAN